MKINENGIIREATEEELALMQATKTPKEVIIAELKQRLADSDYKAIKYAEGLIGAEEYAAVKAERQAWRDEINKIESEEI